MIPRNRDYAHPKAFLPGSPGWEMFSHFQTPFNYTHGE